MTQTIATQEKLYQDAFDRFEANGASHSPGWLRELREAAMSEFLEVGFPVARRGNEEWKYTDVRPLAARPFPQPLAPGKPSSAEIRTATFGERRWHRLVFVDGVLSRSLSSKTPLPHGVVATDMADALKTHEGVIHENASRLAVPTDNAFVALNTAFLYHGAFVYVPNGVAVEEPIHLVFITTRGQEAAFQPRVLVVTGKDSSATVTESYVGLDNSPYFANAVVELALGQGSNLRHYRVQRQSEAAYHICNTQAHLTANSSFTDGNFDFGGGLTRNNLSLLIAEEGTSAKLHGLYMPTGIQHVDNQVIIDYHKGQGTAAEVYKGILNGKARSVFHGSIIVQPNAAKVNANQEDKNLLLSPDAEADTKPAFWIYCDDVKCGHGAACGQIDPEALFYLRSRGLSEAAAKGLMVRGFAAGILDAIQLESLKKHLNNIVSARLEAWLGNNSAN